MNRFFHILATSQQSSVEFQINQTSTGLSLSLPLLSLFVLFLTFSLSFCVPFHATGGDLDSYVRVDKYPSRQEYDYRDISSSRNVKFVIPSPHGVYYLGLYGFLSCNYSVMAIIKTSCPKDCSGHGSCSSNGVCTCRFLSLLFSFPRFYILSLSDIHKYSHLDIYLQTQTQTNLYED